MSILRNELQTLLKALDTELKKWLTEAEFLVEEDHLHTKIHERLRVIAALQQILLEERMPNALRDNRTGETVLLRHLPQTWGNNHEHGTICVSCFMQVHFFKAGGNLVGAWIDVTDHFSFVLEPEPSNLTIYELFKSKGWDHLLAKPSDATPPRRVCMTRHTKNG